MKETIINILNGVFLFIVILFLLDALSPFQIKSQFLKSTVYIGLMIGTVVLLVTNFFFINIKLKRILLTLFPFIVFIGVLILNPMKIIFSSSAWVTQSIYYQSKVDSRRIEYQMQDIGAFGYNQRIVEVKYLTPILMFAKEADLKNIDTSIYENVNIDVNELELKGG